MRYTRKLAKRRKAFYVTYLFDGRVSVCHTEVSPEVICDLSQDSRPIDRIHGPQTDLLTESHILEGRFNDSLTIVKCTLRERGRVSVGLICLSTD